MPDAPNTSWKRISIVYLAGIIAAVQVGVIAPVVPLLQHDLTLSLTSSARSCPASLSSPCCWAPLPAIGTNRFGLTRAVVWGLAMMAIAAALSALVESGGALLAVRAVSGLGYLLTVVACPPLIARLTSDRDRPFALALLGDRSCRWALR